MNYDNEEINKTAQLLRSRFQTLTNKEEILKAVELRALFDAIKTMPPENRSVYGKELNNLKDELRTLVDTAADNGSADLPPIDVTAPFDVNTKINNRATTLTSDFGSKHPLMSELERVLDIFYLMGFGAVESRELDDDYHMFTSLNFPKDHPAKDDYDTFSTIDGYIAPAHTSTMQNRILRTYRAGLLEGTPIAAVIPGRVFRNEDLDSRHEHTFYQIEGIYVGEGTNVGNLIATLKTFLERYYEKTLEVKTQPFYFPFTEPSFEFALSCPFCDKAGCTVCSQTGWIELLGCGMIHPNVLKEADIDSERYSGFAWGMGIDRLVMMKYDIEDIRHFESANLNFLRQFK